MKTVASSCLKVTVTSSCKWPSCWKWPTRRLSGKGPSFSKLTVTSSCLKESVLSNATYSSSLRSDRFNVVRTLTDSNRPICFFMSITTLRKFTKQRPIVVLITPFDNRQGLYKRGDHNESRLPSLFRTVIIFIICWCTENDLKVYRKRPFGVPKLHCKTCGVPNWTYQVYRIGHVPKWYTPLYRNGHVPNWTYPDENNYITTMHFACFPLCRS